MIILILYPNNFQQSNLFKSLKVIEDCAHGIGTSYNKKHVGNFGETGCFSFYATKNLTTGEGGMLITNKKEISSRINAMRLHGLSKDAWKRHLPATLTYKDKFQHYDLTELGLKYNMTDINASMGLVQLKKIEKYWKISRPHGGDIKTGAELKYASMMTSRGCPFACLYCHIAQETKDSKSGPIGRFRIKSDERVRQELDILKNEIGANQIFISDDSIFGMKKRAIRLLRSIIDMGLHLTDVNGMNMVHFVKKSGTPGWMVPDEEVIELLAEVGFKDVVLPFESANPRILKKWCSNKLPLERFNPADLIKTFNKYNISLGTNYMLGFPDETRKEIETTVNFAKEMQQHGID